MNNQMFKTVYLLILFILSSCSTQNEFKKNDLSDTDFLKSKRFYHAKNQFGNIVDFTFEIDTLNKIKYDKTDFYKLNITSYDSIYVGKRNDTIFSLDRKINFKEVFLVLNKPKTSFFGRIGTDYEIILANSNDSILQYSFRKIKNTDQGDHKIKGYDYPELTIKTIEITQRGEILNLTIEQIRNEK